MSNPASATKDVQRARSERLEAQVSVDQKDLSVLAAELQGRTLTGIIIASVDEAAARTIKVPHRIVTQTAMASFRRPFSHISRENHWRALVDSNHRPTA